jgi:hypothetical protein
VVFISYKSLEAKKSAWKYAAQNKKSRHFKQGGGFSMVCADQAVAAMKKT